jgi:hypothetical protein
MTATLTAPEIRYPVEVLRPLKPVEIRSQLDRDAAERQELEKLAAKLAYEPPAEQVERWSRLTLQDLLMQAGIPVLCPESIDRYKARIADSVDTPVAQVQETVDRYETKLAEAFVLTRRVWDMPTMTLSAVAALMSGVLGMLVAALFAGNEVLFIVGMSTVVAAGAALSASPIGYHFSYGLAKAAIGAPRDAVKKRMEEESSKALEPKWLIASIPDYSTHSEIPTSVLRRAAEVQDMLSAEGMLRQFEFEVDYLTWQTGVRLDKSLWEFEPEPLIDPEPFLWVCDRETGARAAIAVWNEPEYEHDFVRSESEQNTL